MYAFHSQTGVEFVVVDQQAKIFMRETVRARVTEPGGPAFLSCALTVGPCERSGDITALSVVSSGGATHAMHNGVVHLTVDSGNSVHGEGYVLIIAIIIAVVVMIAGGRVNSHGCVDVGDERHHWEGDRVYLQVAYRMQKALAKSVHHDHGRRRTTQLGWEIFILWVHEKIPNVGEVHQYATWATAGLGQRFTPRYLTPVLGENGDLVAVLIEKGKVLENDRLAINGIQAIV